MSSYNGYDIYHLMKSGDGPERLNGAREASDRLSKSYMKVDDHLEDQTSTLKAFWKRAGADSGVAALEPLKKINLQYSSNMSRAGDSMNGMASDFNDARESLQPMPEERTGPLHTSGPDASGAVRAKMWDNANKHNINQ